MEQYYKRVEDIDDKVKDARLPYQEWKVLFLVGEKSDAEEISSLIGDDSSVVNDIFESLASKGLITKVEAEEEMEETGDVEEAPAPSIGDELLVEEEDTVDETSEPEESTSEAGEEITEQEDIRDEEVEAVEEEVTKVDEQKIQVNTDFLNEDLSPKDEFPSNKSEQPETSDEESAGVSEEDADDMFDLGLEEGLAEGAVESEVAKDVEEEADSSESSPEPEPGEEQETISDMRKKTIMVIDDSIVIRKMIEIALEDEDFNIVTAISGKEGLENIENQQPNLVILDMMLPDMNGIDVLKTIKSNKKLPVIMLSGKDSPQLIESAKEVGVDDFLPKPFRDEELVEKVRTLVGA